ncbi:hypothetical protein [Vibrio phage JSF7]|uniref:Uncharacterized protein n=1 Tax=Vibrio phage JSF7 TaxID=1292086 RepID=A0A219XCY2_9CAUD|nr:hypothetical protein HOQ92_gp02 [Vibrio phage JSF7]APD18126.1 hypothetical protein [Vibrio phage JSF7]
MAETMHDLRHMMQNIKEVMRCRGLNTTTYNDGEAWLVQGNTPHNAAAVQAMNTLLRSLPSQIDVDLFFNQHMMEWVVVARPQNAQLLKIGVFTA